jgi:hypothetical protein
LFVDDLRATLGNICALYFRSFSNMVATDTACSVKPIRSNLETAMKLKLDSATELAALLAAAIISIGIDTTQSHAAPEKKHDDRSSVYYYGSNGPNISYQSGPHTRIYVTSAHGWMPAPKYFRGTASSLITRFRPDIRSTKKI